MVRMARTALDLAGLRPRSTDDRWLANEVLFRGRHEFPSALYHGELVGNFWSAEPESVGRGERADATDLGGRVDGEGFLSIGMRMGSSARRGRV
jgi:hypothetical protein